MYNINMIKKAWNFFNKNSYSQFDGLVQERRNSSANALELHIFVLTHRIDLVW